MDSAVVYAELAAAQTGVSEAAAFAASFTAPAQQAATGTLNLQATTTTLVSLATATAAIADPGFVLPNRLAEDAAIILDSGNYDLTTASGQATSSAAQTQVEAIESVEQGQAAPQFAAASNDPSAADLLTGTYSNGLPDAVSAAQTPVLAPPVLDPLDDTGVSAQDGLTNDATPDLHRHGAARRHRHPSGAAGERARHRQHRRVGHRQRGRRLCDRNQPARRAGRGWRPGGGRLDRDQGDLDATSYAVAVAATDYAYENSRIDTALGLPTTVDLSAADPLAMAEAGNPTLFLKEVELLDTTFLLIPFTQDGDAGSDTAVPLHVIDKSLGSNVPFDDFIGGKAPAITTQPIDFTSAAEALSWLTTYDTMPIFGSYDTKYDASVLPTVAAIIAASNAAIQSHAAPASSLADTISYALGVEPSGISVSLGTAQTVLPASASVTIDRPAIAQPTLSKSSGAGMLTNVGKADTLDLGTLPEGGMASVALVLGNAAAAPADRCDGLFSTPSGSGFTVTGASLPQAVAAGASYTGLGVAADSSTPGRHSETITFAPRDETAPVITAVAVGEADDGLTTTETTTDAEPSLRNWRRSRWRPPTRSRPAPRRSPR